MLTRSYLTLGEKEKAVAAIKDARAALASDPARLQLFNEALLRFKIDESANGASAQRRFCCRVARTRAAERSERDDSRHGGASCRSLEKRWL